jgi:hypothetical protein
MYAGQIMFAQVMQHLPLHQFRAIVEKYSGNYHVRSFPCLDQFHTMAFAQLTCRESLRDIETCLRANDHHLYHMGIRGPVARSTLADANELRDWRIYADIAYVLIGIAKDLYRDEPIGVEISDAVYALDSTTIDLCMALFRWATFRTTKSAVKMHTLLDLRGSIPDCIWITEGKVHDVNIMDELVVEPGAWYIMDRGYLDFERLYALHQERAYFVIRAKETLAFCRRCSRLIDTATGLRCDQTIVLTGPRTAHRYPESLRRVVYYDTETDRHLEFLTNNFAVAPLVVAKLYRCRWSVELFFKWVKQHLRIKVFHGTSANAVKTQLWIAIATYVLVAILRKRLGTDASLYTILQISSVSIFEKTPILQAISQANLTASPAQPCNQLELFDL